VPAGGGGKRYTHVISRLIKTITDLSQKCEALSSEVKRFQSESTPAGEASASQRVILLQCQMNHEILEKAALVEQIRTIASQNEELERRTRASQEELREVKAQLESTKEDVRKTKTAFDVYVLDMTMERVVKRMTRNQLRRGWEGWGSFLRCEKASRHKVNGMPRRHLRPNPSHPTPGSIILLCPISPRRMLCMKGDLKPAR
jgi:hypothetical protein